MAYFPMFVNLEDTDCLIIGGGEVAYRKVQVLLDFKAQVTVIATNVCERIKQSSVTVCLREAQKEDIENRQLVIAATDDTKINHQIATWCKKEKIPVNAVDQIDDCTFIFPSYIKKGDLVTGISSSGKSPVMTQYVKGLLLDLMSDDLGEVTDFLGDIRERVKMKTKTEKQRKVIYQKVLQIALSKNQLPTTQQVDDWIEECGKEEKWIEQED